MVCSLLRTNGMRILERAATFLRSALAGGAATLAESRLPRVARRCGGLSPRAASVPALLVGAAVQFLGNRHFAFRAALGSLRRQVGLFALTEIVAFTLNAVLYDAAARALPLGAVSAVLVRAVTTNAVFLLWSYPVWRRVFRGPSGAAGSFSSEGGSG